MWVNFARSGDPSTDEYTWSRYDDNSRMTMMIDSGNIRMESNPKGNQREELEPILKYRLNGCYSQMSFNVPTVYKLTAILAGVESVANKYTFVWKKAVSRNMIKLTEKICTFCAECEELYGIKVVYNDQISLHTIKRLRKKLYKLKPHNF